MFFTMPRLPNHVRWNRRLSVHTMVATACRSPSWQCCTFSARKMSLFVTSLCFHGTPWPQFDVKYCSVLARRCQHRCLQTLLSERSFPAKNLTEHIAHSFCVTCVLTSSHSVSSSCGCVQSARIAYPCFPWPRFELGLSSRVPQVSDKRARPPRPIKTRAPRSSVTMQSTLARRHLLRRHHSAHITDVAGSLRLRLRDPMLDWAESSPVTMALHGNIEHPLFFVRRTSSALPTRAP